MGLDSVELLMEVEDAFGIHIPDRIAEKILTVGDFYEVVWEQMRERDNSKCKSQMLFYRFRKAVQTAFDYPYRNVVPGTVPALIVPSTNRREAYFALENTLHLQLPRLVLNTFWNNILFGFGLLAILGSLVGAWILMHYFNYGNWILLLPVIGAVVTWGLSELLEPKRTEIEQPTVKEFIQQTLVLNLGTLMLSEGTNRKEMEQIMNQIISNKCGLDIVEISAEKKIGDDLGID